MPKWWEEVGYPRQYVTLLVFFATCVLNLPKIVEIEMTFRPGSILGNNWGVLI